jgi:hypothetical protein
LELERYSKLATQPEIWTRTRKLKLLPTAAGLRDLTLLTLLFQKYLSLGVRDTKQ